MIFCDVGAAHGPGTGQSTASDVHGLVLPTAIRSRIGDLTGRRITGRGALVPAADRLKGAPHMGTVTATTEATIAAAPADVLAALADYETVRPAILPAEYTDYAVLEGGMDTGTVVTWRLHATKKRVRQVVADITLTGDSVIEKDRNSSMVTTFRVSPAGGASAVTATTTWKGAGGIGGFFEKTFAPKGLARIHEELLGNLAAHMATAR